MEDTKNPRSRSRIPKSVRAEDDSAEPSGCFGIRFRSMSPAQNSHDRTPRPRFETPRSAPQMDQHDPSVPQVNGYAIKGKSAEILGLMPKSAPITPPKSRTPSPLAWRSVSDAAYPRSHEPSIASSKSSISVPPQFQKTTADPLIVVRRRLKQEAAAAAAKSSMVRSSSAPAPTQNYSRKWRQNERFANMESSQEPSQDFLDTSSRDNSIEEEEIPDINKFDAVPKETSDRIRSAAFTTFAWMTLQEEAASLMDGTRSDRGRSSWLLDNVTSPVANVANESKKRTSAVNRSGEASPGFVKRDDKRDTLEWMGVNPGDFPTPISTA